MTNNRPRTLRQLPAARSAAAAQAGSAGFGSLMRGLSGYRAKIAIARAAGREKVSGSQKTCDQAPPKGA